MKIDFVNKINKEHCSLTTLVLGDKEFPLTEKELIQLLQTFYHKREDVFQSEGLIYEDQAKVQRLEERVEELEDANEELERENIDLQDDIDKYERGEWNETDD